MNFNNRSNNKCRIANRHWLLTKNSKINHNNRCRARMQNQSEWRRVDESAQSKQGLLLLNKRRNNATER